MWSYFIDAHGSGMILHLDNLFYLGSTNPLTLWSSACVLQIAGRYVRLNTAGNNNLQRLRRC